MTFLQVFVTFVWNFELYMIPVTLIIIFIKNLVVAHLFGDTLAKDKLDYVSRSIFGVITFETFGVTMKKTDCV